MISASQEDYLEFIYNSLKNDKELRAVDVANYFDITRPSATEALIKLADNDLIIYEGRRGIKITQKGINAAIKINNKHKILFEFFTNKLNINEKSANENACRIIEKIALLNQES